MGLNIILHGNLVEDKKHEHLNKNKNYIKFIFALNTVITYCLFSDGVVQ